jgi:hypothetical protein
MPLLSIQQLAALEALIAANVPGRLAALEASRTESRSRRSSGRVANAERLRADIRLALDAHTGPKPMTAKQVLRALAMRGCDCSRSERTVRLRMQEIRIGAHHSADSLVQQ